MADIDGICIKFSAIAGYAMIFVESEQHESSILIAFADIVLYRPLLASTHNQSQASVQGWHHCTTLTFILSGIPYSAQAVISLRRRETKENVQV